MKKRTLVLGILAIMLVFGMVSCGPEEEPTEVTFVSATANGDGVESSTTYIKLTFSEPINGLSASDIRLSGGKATVSKGDLGGTAPEYILYVNVTDNDNAVTVTVSKNGYKITTSNGKPQTVGIKITTADKAAVAAANSAAKYFGQYQTQYTLTTSMDTTEFVTVEKNSSGNYVLTIEEKKDGTSKDKLTFTIDFYGWEAVDVPDTVIDPVVANESEFTDGFKIKGKITASTSGYLPSNKTTPNFVAADLNTDCWMFIWLGDYRYGHVLVRSPFSKVGKNNESTSSVTGSETPPQIRVYKMEVDD